MNIAFNLHMEIWIFSEIYFMFLAYFAELLYVTYVHTKRFDIWCYRNVPSKTYTFVFFEVLVDKIWTGLDIYGDTEEQPSKTASVDYHIMKYITSALINFHYAMNIKPCVNFVFIFSYTVCAVYMDEFAGNLHWLITLAHIIHITWF